MVYPGLKGEPPVVVIDLSDDSADSISEHITDFVCAHIKGDGLLSDIYKRNSPSFHEVEAFKSKVEMSLNCADKIKFYAGLKKHPRFDEWLDQLDEKYDN